jgi:putative ABC transport system substrate-binding protein
MLAVDFDPVTTGYVRSLRKPGANMTGVNLQQIELTAKRVELLRELLPQLKRVSVLVDPSVRDQLEAAQRSASQLDLNLLPFEVDKPPHDYPAAFRAMRASDPQALLVLLSGTFYRDRAQIVTLAREARLPAVYAATGFVDAGGLLAYGANLDDLFSKAADYVDGIVRGGTPAEMPIEQPTKFDMAINLKTAKALGLTIPQSLLVRANDVIQ